MKLDFFCCRNQIQKFLGMLPMKSLLYSRIQPFILNWSRCQQFGNLPLKFSENQKGNYQDAESHITSEDEQLGDGKSSTVVNTTVFQHCKVADPNGSTDTGIVSEETREKFNKMSLNTKPEEESNTNSVSTDVHTRQLMQKHRFSDYKEKILAENYHVFGYPTPIQMNDVLKRRIYHSVIDKKEFPYEAFLSFGLANFMSYAAHFCKHEVKDKTEIISVGSGNGMVDREIISTYRKHFGEEIKITLVDPNPDYEVDFKKVDDLINARPEAVGNCILLIIWPEPMGRNDGYDVDAIRKLQPLAALVLYDPTEVSGSDELTAFLRTKTNETVGCGWYSCDESAVGLENYAVEKVTGLQTYCEAGHELEVFGMKIISEPATRHLCLRLLKLKRLCLQ